MSETKIALSLLVALTLLGCTNLKEVREYAGESAKLSEYTELTTRFRDTYEREQPYLSGDADLQAQENDKRRKAAYADLLKIHQSVSLYMQILAQLAGDEAFDLSKGVDSVAGGIKAHPDFGIEAKHVDAVSNISKVVTKWITSSHQERAVREMVKESDACLQTTLEGMVSLIRYYKKTNDNERKTVLGLLEVEIPFADSPKDKLLATLARAQLQSKTAEYSVAQLKYDDAERAIKSVADGHKQLYENIDKLSKDEAKTAISKFAKDIKSLRESLQSARG